MERRRQVVADHRVPVERIGLEDEAVADDRCVVDDDVDAAEALHGKIDRRGGGGRAGEAFREGASTRPERRRRVSRHGGIAAAAVDGGAVVGDHHTGALAVQPLDDGAADAAAATGDQRHAAVERAPHQRTTAAIANARFSASL